jgi:hypothetical protein
MQFIVHLVHTVQNEVSTPLWYKNITKSEVNKSMKLSSQLIWWLREKSTLRVEDHYAGTVLSVSSATVIIDKLVTMMQCKVWIGTMQLLVFLMRCLVQDICTMQVLLWVHFSTAFLQPSATFCSCSLLICFILLCQLHAALSTTI